MFTMKDFFRLAGVMFLDNVAYNSDIGAQRYEMTIAVLCALPLNPLYPITVFLHNLF